MVGLFAEKARALASTVDESGSSHFVLVVFLM
jgi:hypothetical protein